jgi:hypothetical protein
MRRDLLRAQTNLMTPRTRLTLGERIISTIIITITFHTLNKIINNRFRRMGISISSTNKTLGNIQTKRKK